MVPSAESDVAAKRVKAEPEGADGEQRRRPNGADRAATPRPERTEHEHEHHEHDSEQLTEDEQPAEVAEMTRNS